MFSKPQLPATRLPRRRPQPARRMNEAQLERQLDVLEQQNRALEEQLRTITQSTSWRVTSPLRWVAHHARHLLRGGAGELSAVRRDYAAWVAAFDTVTPEVRERLQRDLARWAVRPSLSLLMPVVDADPDGLREAVDSVRAQLYPAWELCIAAGPAETAAVQTLLAQATRDDARIRTVVLPPGKGAPCAAAFNRALDLATGAWALPVEPHGRLAPHALACIARVVIERPEAQIVYSDSDRLDAAGQRSDPWFKPDWNPDLFHSQNLLAPLAAFRTALLREAGGWREGFEGAQAYDLALRCVEHVEPAHIVHVPRVLLHARAQVRPVADEAGARSAEARALDQHFGRLGVAAQAEWTASGFRVRYARPAPPPLVSLIIPTRNAVGLVRQCIESIVAETAYPHYEIVLIDNGSDDAEALAYFAELDGQPGITVLRDARPFNYAALNNAAVAQARGTLVALVNNDIEAVSPDWLDEMVALAVRPGVGAVGAKLLYPDGSIQHGGVLLGVGGIAGHAHKHLSGDAAGYAGRAQCTQTLSAVTAACMVVRKDLYQRVGGLDEARLGVAYNDVDFCLRLGAIGCRTVWTPHAVLVHHESATRGSERTAAAAERFARESACMAERWAALIANDPAYSLNLTLHSEDFDLAWPPRVEPLAAAAALAATAPGGAGAASATAAAIAEAGTAAQAVPVRATGSRPA